MKKIYALLLLVVMILTSITVYATETTVTFTDEAHNFYEVSIPSTIDVQRNMTTLVNIGLTEDSFLGNGYNVTVGLPTDIFDENGFIKLINLNSDSYFASLSLSDGTTQVNAESPLVARFDNTNREKELCFNIMDEYSNLDKNGGTYQATLYFNIDLNN